MKVAIYGQYYQNSTEPIIKDIFIFFNRNNVELVIEAAFLELLYEKGIVKKEYNTFSSHTELDQSFDMLVSIGGDGTILRAATLVRDSGIPRRNHLKSSNPCKRFRNSYFRYQRRKTRFSGYSSKRKH